MTQDELKRLEDEWLKETRNIKKYQLLLKGAMDRRAEIERKMKNN